MIRLLKSNRFRFNNIRLLDFVIYGDIMVVISYLYKVGKNKVNET